MKSLFLKNFLQNCINMTQITYQHNNNNHVSISLQRRHNERNVVSYHQPHDCLFRRRLKKASKLRMTGLCEVISPVAVEFPTQRACNAEMFPFEDVIVSIGKCGRQHGQHQLFVGTTWLYSYVTWASWRITLPSIPLFIQLTGDRWMTHTNGQ